MEMDIWKKDFKNYMDFVYTNKRYPKGKTRDKNEDILFNWAKQQRTLYTKNKLSKDKVDLLKDFKFWYFKSIDKNKKLQEINIFFSENIVQENKNIKLENNNTTVNNNIIINISNLNIYYEKEEENNTDNKPLLVAFYDKVISYFKYFKNYNNNLYLEDV